MPRQFSTTLRNAMCDLYETHIGVSPVLEIRSGAPPASAAAADTGTLLASMALPADWMAAASAGVKAMSGTWQDLTADATGTAGHFRIKQGATCHDQGNITATGGGGDMILVNTSIAVGQPVSITTFDVSMGGA